MTLSTALAGVPKIICTKSNLSKTNGQEQLIVTHTGTNNRAQKKTPERWCMSGRNLQKSPAPFTKFSLQRRSLLQVQRRSRMSRSEGKIAPLKFPFFISVCHNSNHLTSLTIKPFCIAVCHNDNHLTHLTTQPTITRLHQGETTNPEPPQKTRNLMHVVNRKQIYKRPC